MEIRKHRMVVNMMELIITLLIGFSGGLNSIEIKGASRSYDRIYAARSSV